VVVFLYTGHSFFLSHVRSDRCSFLVARLQLLNTTVSALALTINRVLTTCYDAIYGDTDKDTDASEELNLVVSPLTSIVELQGLYTSNLVDFETAIPVALHSLGCTAEEISAALQRRRDQENVNADVKAIEQRTTIAELKRRERDANAQPDASLSASGAPEKSRATHASTPAPSSPASSTGEDP
jgi:hypothetical protein